MYRGRRIRTNAIAEMMSGGAAAPPPGRGAPGPATGEGGRAGPPRAVGGVKKR